MVRGRGAAHSGDSTREDLETAMLSVGLRLVCEEDGES